MHSQLGVAVWLWVLVVRVSLRPVLLQPVEAFAGASVGFAVAAAVLLGTSEDRKAVQRVCEPVSYWLKRLRAIGEPPRFEEPAFVLVWI